MRIIKNTKNNNGFAAIALVGSILALFVIGFFVSSHFTSPVQVANAQTSANITVNGSQLFQKVDGFGVNANSASWNNGQLSPAIDMLVDTMGSTVWRVIIESTNSWDYPTAIADPNNVNWTYYDALYNNAKYNDFFGLLGYLKTKNVSHIYANVMGCLPSALGGCSISTANEDKFVESVADLLFYAQNRKGLRIDSISPMNEQDIGSPVVVLVDATQYVRIVNKLNNRLTALGVTGIKVVGPDVAIVDHAVNSYMPSMVTSSSLMAKVDHFVVHSYGGGVLSATNFIKNSAYSTRNLWVSEFSSSCPGCDNGVPPPTDEWNFGVTTTGMLFSFLNDDGAASAMIYDAYDSLYEHHGAIGYWGVMRWKQSDNTYSPTKRMYTNGQVFKFARPGMTRVGISTTLSNIPLLAFLDQATGKVTVVGINNSSNSPTLTVSLANLPAQSSLNFYQTNSQTTSGAKNLNLEGSIPVTNNTFTAKVDAFSVFTFTSVVSGSATPPPTPVPSVTPVPTSTPTPAPQCTKKAQGDANCDGVINSADYDLWNQQYSGLTIGITADFNNDGVVNMVDYGLWALGSGLQPSPAPTPSPTPSQIPTPTPTQTPLPSSSPVASERFGFTSVGKRTDTNDSNFINATQFKTGTKGGQVISMSVNVGVVDVAPNNQYQLAIYADNNGVPGALLAKSNSGTLTPKTWNTVSVSATILPNTYYWLGYNTNGANNINKVNGMRYTATTAVKSGYMAQPFGVWPASFGTPIYQNFRFSIYATYIP